MARSKKRVVSVPSVEPSLNTDLLSASDEQRLRVKYDADLETNINVAGDEKRLGITPPDNDINTDITIAKDEQLVKGVVPSADGSISRGDFLSSSETELRNKVNIAGDIPSAQPSDISSAQDTKNIVNETPSPQLGEISSQDIKNKVNIVGAISVPQPSDITSQDVRNKVNITGEVLSPQPSGISSEDVRNKVNIAGEVLTPQPGDISSAQDESRAVYLPPEPQLSIQDVEIKDKINIAGEISIPQLNIQDIDVRNKVNIAGDIPKPTITDISISDDNPVRRIQHTFNGKWVSKDDPLIVGDENYSDIVNFRYTNAGLEGVGGFAHINTTPTGHKLINGMQLITNYTQDSIILVQTESDADSTDKRIITHRTTGANIPTTGDFSVEGETPDTFKVIVVEAGNKTIVMKCVAGTNNNVTVELTDGYYTPDEFATEFTIKLNLEDDITGGGGPPPTKSFTVTYDLATNKFTITFSTTDVFVLDATSTLEDDIGFAGGGPWTSDGGTPNIIISDNAIKTDTALYEESSSAARARFSLWPNGNIVVCDSVENLIWSGDEQPVAAFLENLQETYLSGASCRDYTHKVRNTDSTENVPVVTTNTYLIGSTRPLSGIYFNMTTLNTAATPSITLKYRDTNDYTAFTEIASKTDNTDGFKVNDKWITWTPPGDEVTYYLGKYSLYFYTINISSVASSPKINYIRTRSNIQEIVDIWDGVFQDPIYCVFVRSTNFTDAVETFDCTDEMGVRTPVKYGKNAQGIYTISFNYLGAHTDHKESYIEVMFQEPVHAMEFIIWDTDNGATLIETVVIQYNDGITYRTASQAYDTTQDSSVKFRKSGAICFVLNASYKENKVTRNGVTGYIYKIRFTGSARYNEVKLDMIRGVTREQVIKDVYLFPFQYRNRAMLCNSINDEDYNRVDYSNTNAPDSFSGPDASGRYHTYSLYFGNREKLTGATSIFTQYGDILQEIALFFKNHETYVLSGNTAEDFQIYKLSRTIGCPSPLTITSADVGLRTPDGRTQSIALWLSDKGPVMFNGASVILIPGVEKYFDQFDSSYITTDFADVRGWYDTTYKEYNLVFPADELWLAYDIVRDKWCKRNITNEFPNGAISVINDDGETYIYLYNDDGYMSQLESGLYWGDNSYTVENSVTTADILPFNDIWIESILRRTQVIFKDNNEGKLNVVYYNDGNTGNTITCTRVVFTNANPDTLTLTSSAYPLASGLRPGMELYVSGSDSNNTSAGSPYTIASINDSGKIITLIAGDTLTVEDKTAEIILTAGIELGEAMAETDNYRIRHLLSNTNLLGWSHKLKIETITCTATKPTLLGWGAEFTKVRDEKLDKSEKN